MIQLSFPFCQRWRHKRGSYRPADEVINTSRYDVGEISEKDAKEFVRTHHYSGSYPAARFRTGLYRAGELVGVAVFGIPCHPLTFARYVDDANHVEGVELSRFVLLDDVPGNGETWFLGQSFGILQEGLSPSFVLSFSDPVPRYKLSGEVVMPGHVGTIYQAHNGQYVGRSKPKTFYLTSDGTAIYRRTLNKLKNGESGAGYVADMLTAIGAPTRCSGQSDKDWVSEILSSGVLTKTRHPGNHAYLWATGNRREKKSTSQRFRVPLEYPKLID
jgi:hypothetical protein